MVKINIINEEKEHMNKMHKFFAYKNIGYILLFAIAYFIIMSDISIALTLLVIYILIEGMKNKHKEGIIDVQNKQKK